MGTAKAAPWALQKPKLPKAFRVPQTLSTTSGLYFLARASLRKNSSTFGSSTSLPSARRNSSARARPHPVMTSKVFRICSWKTVTPWVS